jgi:anti-sigma-K factor RskA
MAMNTHVIELLPAYTLDCLDEEDMLLVTEHLAVCPTCRAELISYQGVADRLAMAVPCSEPPADLRRRLMAHVQPQRPQAISQPRPAWWRPLGRALRALQHPAWGVASLALILALVASNVLLWQQVNRPGVPFNVQSMRTLALAGTASAPEASGIVVISTDGEYGTLVVDNLPTLDKTQQYQLWLTQDGTRTSGAVFSVGRDGYGSVPILAPEPLTHYSSFGITVEPSGGSPHPTGVKVLGGAF